MRKFFTLFAAALVTCVSMQAEILKIGVNDSRMEYAPVYVTWADKYYCSQIIYSASDLVNMKGKEITHLAFFLKKESDKGDFANVEIRLKKVSHTTFSDTNYESIDDAVLVFNGTLPSSTQTVLEVELIEPYFYESGHLLVDVRKTVTGGGYGSSSDKNAGRFQSTFSEGVYTVLYNYNSSSFPTSGTQSGNRPDIRFTYQDHVEATCAKPSNLKLISIEDKASFEWVAGGEESQWQTLLVEVGQEADWSKASLVSEAKASVAVNPSTKYVFYVRAYCSADDQSDAVKVEFESPCEPIAELPYEEDFEMVYGETLRCWELFQAGEYPSIGSASGLEHGGSSYLQFKGGKGEKQMAVLPAFEKPISELRVTFWNNSVIEFEGRATLEIGYLTNAKDSASFVSCKTLGCYKEYKKVACTFENAPADAKRIALRYANATADYAVSTYVDDLRVGEASTETSIETVNDTPSSRKMIINGNLIIENNGVRYNAQGAVVNE